MRQIPWQKVQRVQNTTRGQYLIASNFMAHRYCTASAAIRDQYRIDYQGGYILFPPEDPAIFLSAIARYAPHAIAA